MRRWASWWLALQQPAGGRSQMADGEGREGRWWPVGGLARTKPAALRATRLHPCVVALGLASNTPRRRPLNYSWFSAAVYGTQQTHVPRASGPERDAALWQQAEKVALAADVVGRRLR